MLTVFFSARVLKISRPSARIARREARRAAGLVARAALQAAAREARKRGYEATLVDAALHGDATTAGGQIAEFLRRQGPGIWLWGGETTVRLASPGTGWEQSRRGDCIVAHEIGRGPYEAYVWGHDLRRMAELGRSGRRIVTNLHADTLAQAQGALEVTRGQPCSTRVAVQGSS